MVNRLGREEWLRASRLALLKGGVEAVRVEKLARDLKVTKGSFYWHFKDRAEILEALLGEWERELSGIAARLQGTTGRDRILSLLAILADLAKLSGRGRAPSDAAIFAWAAVSPEVARRVNKAERERIKFLARLTKSVDQAEILYMTWLGFVARGQRIPQSRKKFPRLARALLDVVLCEPRASRRNRREAI